MVGNSINMPTFIKVFRKFTRFPENYFMFHVLFPLQSVHNYIFCHIINKWCKKYEKYL